MQARVSAAYSSRPRDPPRPRARDEVEPNPTSVWKEHTVVVRRRFAIHSMRVHSISVSKIGISEQQSREVLICRLSPGNCHSSK